jgi:hypothetical protein
LLRSKLNKSNEDLDTIESTEAAIGKVQKNLLDLQSEVPAFYVWGENPDTTEALLKVPMSSITKGRILFTAEFKPPSHYKLPVSRLLD